MRKEQLSAAPLRLLNLYMVSAAFARQVRELRPGASKTLPEIPLIVSVCSRFIEPADTVQKISSMGNSNWQRNRFGQQPASTFGRIHDLNTFLTKSVFRALFIIEYENIIDRTSSGVSFCV